MSLREHMQAPPHVFRVGRSVLSFCLHLRWSRRVGNNLSWEMHGIRWAKQQQQGQKQTLLVKTQENACVRRLEAVLRTVVSFVGCKKLKTETNGVILAKVVA